MKKRNIPVILLLPLLSLSCSLSHKMERSISKVGLSHARIYFNVLNPFTFTQYVGWDPEYATTTLQNGNGPSTVTYQIGVNLKF